MPSTIRPGFDWYFLFLLSPFSFSSLNFHPSISTPTDWDIFLGFASITLIKTFFFLSFQISEEKSLLSSYELYYMFVKQTVIPKLQQVVVALPLISSCPLLLFTAATSVSLIGWPTLFSSAMYTVWDQVSLFIVGWWLTPILPPTHTFTFPLDHFQSPQDCS